MAREFITTQEAKNRLNNYAYYPVGESVVYWVGVDVPPGIKNHVHNLINNNRIVPACKRQEEDSSVFVYMFQRLKPKRR